MKRFIPHIILFLFLAAIAWAGTVTVPGLGTHTTPRTTDQILIRDSSTNEDKNVTLGLVQPEFNVLWYGATTDGSDNATAFQDAIDAANAVSSGATVFIPNGTYAFTGSGWLLQPKSNVTILGESKETTILETTGSDRVTLFGKQSGQTQLDNFTIKNITLKGNNAYAVDTFDHGYAIRIRESTNIHVENVKFIDWPIAALTFIAGLSHSNLYFHGNDILPGDSNNTALGVNVPGMLGKCIITDNYFYRITRAFSTEVNDDTDDHIEDLIFANNTIRDGLLSPIASGWVYAGVELLVNQTNAKLDRAVIANNIFSGGDTSTSNDSGDIVIIDKAGGGRIDNVKIADNIIIAGSRPRIIQIREAFGVNITGNIIEGAAATSDGIWLFKGGKHMIASNSFKGTFQYPISPQLGAGVPTYVTIGPNNYQNITATNLINAYTNIFNNNGVVFDGDPASGGLGIYREIGEDARIISYDGFDFYTKDASGFMTNGLRMSLGGVGANSGGIIIDGGTEIKKHISGTDTWDPGNLADGASERKSVTVTGAAVGETAIAGLSTIAATGWDIQAAVIATNTVEVKITNNTGGAVDLGSGTVRADVWQH